MDPYQSCPCGSGKNFKWCCQPFYPLVEKARSQHQQGQHDTALKTMHELVQKHPGSAPALGYQSELLYMSGKAEEADEALQKAFAIDPNFPFGHFLRGILRREEGEVVGALIEFRKAADLYSPKATEVLAEIYAAIFDIEMRLNRPVAGRAALDRAIRYDSSAEQLRSAYDNLFTPVARIPECARKQYEFRTADAGRMERWKEVLPNQEQARFSDALTAFEKLTAQDNQDAAAWFNLGLVRAWLGDNAKAIEALGKSIELVEDETLVAEAGALMEVLRCGSGLEDQANFHEHRIFFQISQPEPLVQMIESWARSARLSGVESNPEDGTLSGLILEETPQFGEGIGAPAAKLASYMFVVGNIMRLWGPNKESVEKVGEEVRGKLGGASNPPMHEAGAINFADVTIESMLFPTRKIADAEMSTKMQEHAQNFFEEVWIHRPIKSLAGVSPIDAVSHPAYRKQLLGFVKFVEDCFMANAPRVEKDNSIHIIIFYDFSRLRRKLGLAADVAEPAKDATPSIDVMSVSELAGLDPAPMNDGELAQAFRAALKLDARDVAGKFAQTMVDRPAVAGSDRYPFFNHLMQLAQADNNTAGVLTLLDRAEKADVESNEGKRQNDYALRRGQLLAKTGQIDAAYQTFQGLLARATDELKLYGPAIESMLSQRKGAWALQFAEQGLAKARSQNNRDSEQYFMELADAAKRLC